MTFSNLEVDLESLPRFDDVQFLAVHPRYPFVASGIVVALEFIVLIAFTLAMVMSPQMRSFVVFGPGWFPAGALFLALTFLAWFVYKSATVIRYAVRQHDVLVRSGVFWKKETVQPIKRIQHVEQAQGPVDKRFGFYKIKLFSAGTGHFTFEIPGLDTTAADGIKQLILDFRRMDDNQAARSGDD
jgi:membrane protein YdbS with pleckstrin-like domain